MSVHRCVRQSTCSFACWSDRSVSSSTRPSIRPSPPPYQPPIRSPVSLPSSPLYTVRGGASFRTSRGFGLGIQGFGPWGISSYNSKMFIPNIAEKYSYHSLSPSFNVCYIADAREQKPYRNWKFVIKI